MRTRDLTPMMDLLEGLACVGGVRPGAEEREWLLTTGATSDDEESGWLLTDHDWVCSVLPAKNHLDLLRETAIRDPLYRFHLDVLVSQVLQAVARSERWARFEELMSGPFLYFAPRFVQLLELASLVTGVDRRELTESSWAALAVQVERADAEVFTAWDGLLWGRVKGGAAAIFPNLTDLYAPLARRAVNVNSSKTNLAATELRLLEDLVSNSRVGEGVFFTEDDRVSVKSLQDIGLPVRVWPPGGGAERRMLAGLVAPVRFATGSGESGRRVDGAILPCVARETFEHVAGAQAGRSRTNPSEGIWSVWDSIRNQASGLFLGSLGFVPRKGDWPRLGSDVPVAPSGAEVPLLESIKIADKKSPEADESVRVLAKHVVFGLIIQVLVIEALDRELNKESLTLTPPQDHKVDDVVNSTRVLYHPPSDPSSGEKNDLPAYNLGDFGEVMREVAGDLNIVGVPEPFKGGGCEPWPTALNLLWHAGVVTPRHYGWGLSEEVLDRLHGGGLMKGVLRRGQDMRNAIHNSLRRMWEEKHRLSQVSRGGVNA
jgi:hypothetical protein